MSNVVKPVVEDNTYFELTKIELLPVWKCESFGDGGLSSMTYAAYSKMRAWLEDTNTTYKFQWNDPGKYLPDYLWIDSKSDSATYFKLKYGV